jgi:hypothetical protein
MRIASTPWNVDSHFFAHAVGVAGDRVITFGVVLGGFGIGAGRRVAA